MCVCLCMCVFVFGWVGVGVEVWGDQGTSQRPGNTLCNKQSPYVPLHGLVCGGVSSLLIISLLITSCNKKSPSDHLPSDQPRAIKKAHTFLCMVRCMAACLPVLTTSLISYLGLFTSLLITSCNQKSPHSPLHGQVYGRVSSHPDHLVD